jgi:MoxR-like ATPase
MRAWIAILLLSFAKGFLLPPVSPTFPTIQVIREQSTKAFLSSSQLFSEITTNSYVLPTPSLTLPFIRSIPTNATLDSIRTGGTMVLDTSQSVWDVWKRCLLKGRVPIMSDFTNMDPWPSEPFFTAITQTLTESQFPRIIQRHPELLMAVLRTLINKAQQFEHAKKQQQFQPEVMDELDDISTSTDDESTIIHDIQNDHHFLVNDHNDTSVSEEFLKSLAETVASEFMDEYGSLLLGITSLDQLFGIHHGLLDTNSNQNAFGLDDGIWQHTGWKLLPDLQRQLQSMLELNELIQKLGRRPTVDTSIDRRLHRFPPRHVDPDGTMGAHMDPIMRNNVDGLTLSGSFTEMLPSEASLLLSQSSTLRRLFLAKKVERKLLSYQLMGHSDVLSTPDVPSPYRSRLPSGPGGPIVVCLDTSWSMSGSRETLSKAVVVACVMTAHQQHRDCQIVAYSNVHGVMDAGIIQANSAGIHRLLDFLSHSFGGGTDVTGALSHILNLWKDPNNHTRIDTSDLLLITDGEIPDPPVSEQILQELNDLQCHKGVQIHGLLIGRNESKPLSKLCTYTYDFLSRYDTIGALQRQLSSSALSASATSSSHFFTGWGRKHQFPRRSLRLFALQTSDGNTPEEFVIMPYSNDYATIVEQAIQSLKEEVMESSQARAWSSSSLDAEMNRIDSCWKHHHILKYAIAMVGENLVERKEESQLLVLSLLAGEHILFLGPPGTGKSLLGGRLSQLCGGSFFQRLLTRFTTPEELFGPLSLRALENDEYKRCTEGYLPTASVAFLDEIFKANSAILNTLLTILNERKFDNSPREDCPIRCVVGASNELPESDELDALYDRFLLRKEVKSVSDEGLLEMLMMPASSTNDRYNDPSKTFGHDSLNATTVIDDLESAIMHIQNAANAVAMSPEACYLIRDLRHFMNEKLNVVVSDRRLVKVAHLLKISAASHGRTVVDPIDCWLLQNVMWRLPEQRAAIQDWLWDHITPYVDEMGLASMSVPYRIVLNNLRRELLEAVRRTAGDVIGVNGGRSADIRVIQELHIEVIQLSNVLKSKSDVLSRHMELLNRCDSHLWMDMDEALSMKQLLLPKATAVANNLRSILTDARSLELALDAKRVEDPIRLSVIEGLGWESEEFTITFSNDELGLSMREAKSKYSPDIFRKWKRARKKLNNE